jgi:hypothetical protein
MLPTWLSRIVGCKARQSRPGRSSRRPGRARLRPLALEALEGRNLPSFIAPALYDTGQGPYGLATGDLRGNGRFDVVTANATGASVSVLLGNGDGTFLPAVDFATGGGFTLFVALARLRPGGPLDVITANPDSGTVDAVRTSADFAARAKGGGKGRRLDQARLLRDIFGNPFRPAQVAPAWLRWRGGMIVHMAQAIYDERRFQDVPILADALEEAGCTDLRSWATARARGACAGLLARGSDSGEVLTCPERPNAGNAAAARA